MAASAAPRRSAPLPVENGVRNNKNVWVVFDAPPSPSPEPGIGSGEKFKNPANSRDPIGQSY